MIRNINPLIVRALSMGRKWELVAVAPVVVSLRSGPSLSDATTIPVRSARIMEPWATGLAVIQRGDPITRFVALDRGCIAAFGVDGDRRIESVPLELDDAELVAVIWAIFHASGAPDAEEVHRCLLLSAALRAGMLPDVVVSRWSDGDLGGLAAELDLPAGSSARELYAIAHSTDIATHYPEGDAPEDVAILALQSQVPPRWVIAEDLRQAGREDLFDLVMEAN